MKNARPLLRCGRLLLLDARRRLTAAGAAARSKASQLPHTPFLHVRSFVSGRQRHRKRPSVVFSPASSQPEGAGDYCRLLPLPSPVAHHYIE